MSDRIRPEVLAFARVMSAKIDGHNHDRGEHGWRTATPIDLLDWLHRYFGDLQDAARAFAFRGETDARGRVLAKAANVANLAMMIADVCGAIPAPATPTPTTPPRDALRDVRENLDSLLRGVQNGHFGPPDEEFTRRVAAAFAALRSLAAPSPEATPPAPDRCTWNKAATCPLPVGANVCCETDCPLGAEAKPPATTREPDDA